MNTKNIFKTLAFAMLMPTMLLTTACSNQDDIANTSNITSKGYALPVTVNVTRQGDGVTRATYNESTRKLEFSDGDKLFVRGNYDHWTKMFAGTLDYDAESGKFKGTIYTQDDTYKTYEDLFGNSDDVTATLLPAGYEDHGYLVINTQGTEEKYDDLLVIRNVYTLATSKADGVAQFSNEQSFSYNDGFALSPDNAILNFTITGLVASTSVNVSLTSLTYNITGTVTTDASGNATFAAGIMDGLNLQPFSLTVGGNPVTITSSNKVVAEGKIYNITRPATVDLSQVSGTTYMVSGDVIFTGTPTTNSTFTIYIAGECTVTLDNVNSSGEKSVTVSGSTYDKNLMLKGTSHLQRILGSPMKSLTIDKAEVGGTVIVNSSSYAIAASTVTVNGGIVKAKSSSSYAVRANLVVNGGAVYLEGGYDSFHKENYPAVKDGTISGSVTLYGYNGSAWGSITSGSTSTERYVSTDNSAAPTSWTW